MREWVTMERMMELIRLFRERLIQRVSLYPIQLDEGGYTVVRKSLTDDVIRQHVTGQLTLGLYPAPDSTTKWLCVDVDTLEHSALEMLWQRLSQLQIPYLTEFSGRKGYHIWIFFHNAVQNRIARDPGRLVTGDHEVFPKQDVIAEGGLGNLVKAPLGIHRVTGKRCLFVGQDLKVLPDQLKAFSEPRTIDPAQVLQKYAPPACERQIASNSSHRQVKGDNSHHSNAHLSLHLIKDCVRCAIQAGADEGDRNQVGYIIATELRRIGMPMDAATHILRTVWNRRNRPSLDNREIACIVRSAYSNIALTFGCRPGGPLRQVLDCIGSDNCLYTCAFQEFPAMVDGISCACHSIERQE